MSKDTKTIRLRPVHPGRILQDHLDDKHLTANALSIRLRVPASRISEILHGRRSITAETAIRLEQFFGTAASLWLRLQAAYDLAMAERDCGAQIRQEVASITNAA